MKHGQSALSTACSHCGKTSSDNSRVNSNIYINSCYSDGDVAAIPTSHRNHFDHQSALLHTWPNIPRQKSKTPSGIAASKAIRRKNDKKASSPFGKLPKPKKFFHKTCHEVPGFLTHLQFGGYQFNP